MKYYSDKTKELYDTVDALNRAEASYDKAHEKELRIEEERKRLVKECKEAKEKYDMAWDKLIDFDRENGIDNLDRFLKSLF